VQIGGVAVNLSVPTPPPAISPTPTEKISITTPQVTATTAETTGSYVSAGLAVVGIVVALAAGFVRRK
jgi:hypothetical protein